MSVFNGVVVYVCIWWVIFFMALPVGVRRTHTPEVGHDSGAPQVTHLPLKILITSLLSAAALLAINLWLV